MYTDACIYMYITAVLSKYLLWDLHVHVHIQNVGQCFVHVLTGGLLNELSCCPILELEIITGA